MMFDWIGRVFRGEYRSHGVGRTKLNDPPAARAGTSWVVASDELAAELERARRYGHGFSIGVFAVTPSPQASSSESDRRVPEASPPYMSRALAAGVLKELMRDSDIVCYQPAANRFVLGFPVAGSEAAGNAIERVREHFRESLELDVQGAFATFPEDALTVSDLIGTAAARLSSRGASHASNNGDDRGDEIPPQGARWSAATTSRSRDSS